MRRGSWLSWAAIGLSLTALVITLTTRSNPSWVRPAVAHQEIPAEGQKIARELSAAFEAVADFARPSVVQIATTKRFIGNARELFPGFPFPDGPGQGEINGRPMTPEEIKKFREEMRRLFENLPFPGGRPPFDFDFEIRPQQLQGPGIQGAGSGFVFDDAGHILTNNHVVADSDTIRVTFHDGKTFDAKLVAGDPKTDVAVIKVETTAYRPLPLGDSDALRVGQWVLAIGSPFGLQQSVTAGIISATKRGSLGILGADGFGDFIQTDCAINPGNSGGPLIDLNGRVVAVNSAIATQNRTFAGAGSNSGVGFAIPINLAAEIGQKLIKDGKITRAQIGILFGELNDQIARELNLPEGTKGIVIGRVLPGSPADKAGLKPEDVVTGFQGEPIDDTTAFRKKVADSPVGSKVKLDVIREGKPMVVELELASAEEVAKLTEEAAAQGNAPRPFANPERRGNRNRNSDASNPLADFGLRLQNLSPGLARAMGYDAGTKGVVVVELRGEGPAARAGLELGDLIVAVTVGGQTTEVESLDQVVQAIGDTKEVVFKARSPDGKDRLVVLRR